MTRPPMSLLAIRDACIRICPGCDQRVLGDRCGLCDLLAARMGGAA